MRVRIEGLGFRVWGLTSMRVLCKAMTMSQACTASGVSSVQLLNTCVYTYSHQTNTHANTALYCALLYTQSVAWRHLKELHVIEIIICFFGTLDDQLHACHHPAFCGPIGAKVAFILC